MRDPGGNGVVIDNLWKTYSGGIEAVRGVDLEVRDGEFLVLVGPSGCGKSTVLRLIAGLEEITSGTVSIGGRVVNDLPPKDRDIAMVFQNYALYPHMTAYENMAFGLRLRRVPAAEIDRRVREAARMLGIEDKLTRRPKLLSGGERQRVAVGRAIVRQPRAFLFDEPLSNLDAKMRVQMRAEIRRLHDQLNATMIYVTHDQVEAMTMGDRIAVMSGGVLHQVAAPADLYASPRDTFVAGFIGAPPMNLVNGEIVEIPQGLAYRAAALTFPVPEEWRPALEARGGRNVVFGIRPEHMLPHARTDAICARLRAEVEVIEPAGAETYLYLAAGSGRLVARVDPALPCRAGDTLEFGVPLSRAHLFDAGTSLAIPLRQPAGAAAECPAERC